MAATPSKNRESPFECSMGDPAAYWRRHITFHNGDDMHNVSALGAALSGEMPFRSLRSLILVSLSLSRFIFIAYLIDFGIEH